MDSDKLFKHLILTSVGTRDSIPLFDVISTNVESFVPGGVSSKLLVSRYSPNLPRITRLPSFKLVPHRKSNVNHVNGLLNDLSKKGVAGFIQLNKDWHGYIVPDPAVFAFVCYYEPNDSSLHAAPSRPLMKSLFEPQPSIKSLFEPEPVTQSPLVDLFAPQPGKASGCEIFIPLPNTSQRSFAAQSRTNGVVTGGKEQAIAATHYNSLVRKKETQAESFIYHLRRYNNWVKAQLVKRSMPAPGKDSIRVLDLACGKGGDLTKWGGCSFDPKVYVGIDIAKQSLEDMVVRVEEIKQRWLKSASIRLIAADLGSGNLYSDPSLDVWTRNKGWSKDIGLRPVDEFDVVSMQFALHYMAQSEAMLRRFLFFVSRHLRLGGEFVCTTTDPRVLMELLMGHSELSEDGKNLVVDMMDSWGHNLLTIKFEGNARDELLRSDASAPDALNPVGIQYHYILREEVQGQEAVDAPEWMVPLDALNRIAREAGLEIQLAQNFHEFYARTMKDGGPTALESLTSMNVTNYKGTMDPAEWAIARLYMALVLVKVGECDDDLMDTEVRDFIKNADKDTEMIPEKVQKLGPFTPRTPDHPPPGWAERKRLREMSIEPRGLASMDLSSDPFASSPKKKKPVEFKYAMDNAAPSLPAWASLPDFNNSSKDLFYSPDSLSNDLFHPHSPPSNLFAPHSPPSDDIFVPKAPSRGRTFSNFTPQSPPGDLFGSHTITPFSASEDSFTPSSSPPRDMFAPSTPPDDDPFASSFGNAYDTIHNDHGFENSASHNPENTGLFTPGTPSGGELFAPRSPSEEKENNNNGEYMDEDDMYEAAFLQVRAEYERHGDNWESLPAEEKLQLVERRMDEIKMGGNRWTDNA